MVSCLGVSELSRRDLRSILLPIRSGTISLSGADSRGLGGQRYAVTWLAVGGDADIADGGKSGWSRRSGLASGHTRYGSLIPCAGRGNDGLRERGILESSRTAL